MIADRLHRLREYVGGEVWTKVGALLATMSADTPDGEYPIDGDAAYARVMSYDCLPAAGREPEAHEKYIDLQMTLDGCEGIELFDPQGLPVTRPYNVEKDIVFFSAAEAKPFATIQNRPGFFTILYPQDAHLPKTLVAREAARVKKVVVKVRIA